MNRDQPYWIFLIFLTLILIFTAGCTSKAPEPAAPDLPATAHAVKTPLPMVTDTISPEIPATIAPVSTEAESVSALSVPLVMADFSEGGIAFRYPDRFRLISNASLEKMRAVAEPRGIGIITILTATDSKDSVQVTRQNAEATIEEMYTDKMSITQEIEVNGSATVMGMTFKKYDVEKQSLADGSGVVKIRAENSEDGTAVTYLLCKPGAVYNLNFIYESPQRAESQASVRDEMMQTVQMV